MTAGPARPDRLARPADEAAASPAWVRVGLGVLAVGQGLPGAWALLLPRRFFDDYPLPGRHWVAAFPPFNEHLMRDFGALVLAVSAVLGCAAWVGRPWLVRAAGLALLVFSVPHLVFHGGHLQRFGGWDVCAQLATLGLPIVMGALALAAAARTTDHSPRPSPSTRKAGEPMSSTLQDQRLRKRFELWDSDGDGRMDRSDWESEARRILRSFDESPDSAKGRAVLDAYLGMWEFFAGRSQAGADGSINYQEFSDIATGSMLDRGQAGFDEVLRPTIGSILGLCDTDGDGQVSPKEFRSWIEAIGSDQGTADDAFQAIDTNGDGQLSVEELVQAVHRYHAGELNISLL